MLLEHATYLAFNFTASVGVIFVNKMLFATVKFKFTTLLTALHYVITLGGLELLAACGVYERRSSPTTPRMTPRVPNSSEVAKMTPRVPTNSSDGSAAQQARYNGKNVVIKEEQAPILGRATRRGGTSTSRSCTNTRSVAKFVSAIRSIRNTNLGAS